MQSGADSDGDGVGDQSDNCPTKRNANQANKNCDGIGDRCDRDIDGNLAPNTIDNCRTTPNANQTDKDGDGFDNRCDSFPYDPRRH